ncbi:MAG: hypothetical protein N2202_02520 [Proteobacteria bacterium]|nr:hypothetical protein [Pseudomonadota bacterium]
MKGIIKLFVVLTFPLFFQLCFAIDNNNEVNIILDSAETFFKSLEDRNFDKVWFYLSKKSQEKLIDDVYNASKSTGVTYSIEQLRSDFSINGFIAKSYWNGFLKDFDPHTVLNDCIWEKVLKKRDSAEIIIRHKKSENPFNLKMIKENGEWKVGLVETFWKK